MRDTTNALVVRDQHTRTTPRLRAPRSPVARDLAVDHVQIAVKVGDVVQDPIAVRLQQLSALPLGGRADLREFGIPQHLADRHAGRAQSHQQRQPPEVLLRVLPTAGGVAGDALQQAHTLVPAQRVGGQAGQCGDLPDGERFVDVRDEFVDPAGFLAR